MTCWSTMFGAAIVAAQPPTPAAPSAPQADPFEVDVIRARSLAGLGRYDEALAILTDLLGRRPGDRRVREYHAETLVEAGRTREAALVIDRYLADDPRSVTLRRLQARLDVERGHAAQAVATLEGLWRELPDEPGLVADLAYAESRTGRYTRALALYDEALRRHPGDPALQAARDELAFVYAPRIELLHRTLLQEGAESHVQELAWRGWLADRWWFRPAARFGIYDGDRSAVGDAFTEHVFTLAALAGVQLHPDWALRAGIDEAFRDDFVRTTLRLGGAFDDRRATRVDVDLAVRELLTNPVAAVPLNGATDRATVTGLHTFLPRVAIAGHYEYRRYRARSQDLGGQWEAHARVELDLVRRPTLRVTLMPQVFFSEYDPDGPADLQARLPFLRRQDILATGLVVSSEPLPPLRLTGGAVGRRDVFRDVTSYEVSGSARWRVAGRVEAEALYVRSTESTRIGGTEQTFFARVNFLY